MAANVGDDWISLGPFGRACVSYGPDGDPYVNWDVVHADVDPTITPSDIAVLCVARHVAANGTGSASPGIVDLTTEALGHVLRAVACLAGARLEVVYVSQGGRHGYA